MFFQFSNLKLRRVVTVFLMSVVMLLTFIPCAFAIPGTSSDVPGDVSNLGWIDLSATVPEGFSGSVFVQIRNTADDSYYDIECFVLNNFKNSKQVPLGNYVIEVATTPTDPFIYTVSCEVEEFSLSGSYPLHVVVEKVVDSDGALAESIENIEVGSELTDENESVDLPADVKTDEVNNEGSSDATDSKSTSDLKEDNSGKSPYSLLISFVISLLLILVVGFVMWKMKNR